MTAGAVVERVSYCPRERRRIERWRTDTVHRAWVLFQREVWRVRDGKLPMWRPGPNLRTVEPLIRRMK